MKASVITLVLVTMLAIVPSKEFNILDDFDAAFGKVLDDEFKRDDLNNDGFIDLEEFINATETTIAVLPSEFDTDNDGKYNRDEYFKAIDDFLDSLLDI